MAKIGVVIIKHTHTLTSKSNLWPFSDGWLMIDNGSWKVLKFHFPNNSLNWWEENTVAANRSSISVLVSIVVVSILVSLSDFDGISAINYTVASKIKRYLNYYYYYYYEFDILKWRKNAISLRKTSWVWYFEINSNFP